MFINWLTITKPLLSTSTIYNKYKTNKNIFKFDNINLFNSRPIIHSNNMNKYINQKNIKNNDIMTLSATFSPSANANGDSSPPASSKSNNNNNDDDNNNSILSSSSSSSSSGGSFDSEFADMMSKPLPSWFEEELKEKEKFNNDLERNREKVKKEFAAKYEITEEEKLKALEAKWKVIAKNDQNWEAAGKKGDTSKYDRETKKQWRKFWKQEEEDTGFYLPGFFEVFPELRFLWPTWAKNRRGQVLPCQTDEDCEFPQACCPHPILPGEKFCCTGTGQRILVPQYCPQEIMADNSPRDGSDDTNGGYDEPRQDDAYYFGAAGYTFR